MTTFALPSPRYRIGHELIETLTSSRRAALWLLVAFCTLSAGVGRLSYLFKPFDHDARMFIYMGKLVCDGGRFCHDIVDNKFPSVGLITSVFWRMYGTNWAGYVLIQAAAAAGGAMLLGRTAARHFGVHARLPTMLFAIVYLNLNVAVFGGFQLETLQAFFAILAAGAAIEALSGGRTVDAFVAGLCAGCATMLKPTGGAVLAAFAFASLIAWRRYWPRLIAHGVAASAGLAIPMTLVLVYLIRTDIIGDMPELYRQISRYAAETPIAASDLLKPLIVLVIAGFPIIVRAWVFRRPKERMPAPVDPILALFTVSWLVLELLGAVAQRRMYAYHFLVVAPPAALLYGMIPRKDRIVPIAAALLPAAMLSIVGAKQVVDECYPCAYRLQVSDYLLAHTKSNDSVWMDSVPRLLLETDLKPGSRIPLAFLFFNYDMAPLDYSATMLRDFELRRPKYILLPQNMDAKLKYETERAPEMARRPVRASNYRIAWHRIEAYVKEHYAAETAMEGQVIYRRRD